MARWRGQNKEGVDLGVIRSFLPTTPAQRLRSTEADVQWIVDVRTRNWKTPARKLAFAAILHALAKHKVDFVLVGGLSAVLHGSPMATFDVDVIVADRPENLARLDDARRELSESGRADALDVKALDGPESYVDIKGNCPVLNLGRGFRVMDSET